MRAPRARPSQSEYAAHRQLRAPIRVREPTVKGRAAWTGAGRHRAGTSSDRQRRQLRRREAAGQLEPAHE